MEAKIADSNSQPGVLHRLRPAVLPVLLISFGYVDPGKWVATVEGGARFGFDLVALMLLFNLAAILCQYLSARIGVVTGKDLAEICSDEYDKSTCMLLGVQAELSVIALDLTMVLGIANGLNLFLGVDLSTGVFLAAFDAILLPVFITLLEKQRTSMVSMFSAGFILLSYVFGVLLSQPEVPLSMGVLTRLSGETAFTLMSLLGASIMPHNFYLHSYFTKNNSSPLNISKTALCQDHLLAIFCVFSSIYLVNYVLMNSAANVFYSSGLGLLTFQDAISLMEQVFRIPLVPVAFLLLLFVSNQVTALTWNFGGEVVLHDFLRLDIPGWLHRATIRIIATVPALCCVWTSGAEGIYQLLVYTQVMVALLLPSSVIPLFRVASSRPIMGVHKISPLSEFLALITFMGMLCLNVIFVVEIVFGSSDWVGNLRWNVTSSMSISYVALLVTALSSFCFMLWLAATPLKSSTDRTDGQVRNWDIQNAVAEPSTQREEIESSEPRHPRQESIQVHEQPTVAITEGWQEASVCSLQLPETIMESDQEIRSSILEEKHSNISFSSPLESYKLDSVYNLDSVSESVSISLNKATDEDTVNTLTTKSQLTMQPAVKIVGEERDIQTERDDDEADTWEPEEQSKTVPASISSFSYDGPSSLRSLKSDDGGNGAGSLSRLAGLGRAARRHLAAVLDEFWGQLYDFHGQVTSEAKAKKLDMVLGGFDPKLQKMDSITKEFSGYIPPTVGGGGMGSDSLISSSIYEPLKPQRVHGTVDSSYGLQRASSSLWSSSMNLLDTYGQQSGRSIQDSGERRYSSLRTAPSPESWDYQPATIHGYQIASYLSRISKEKSSDYMNGQVVDSPVSKSPSLGPTNYSRGQRAYSLSQKLHSGITSTQASGYQNFAVSRNSPLQSERSYYDVVSPSGPADNNVGIPANAKKYHSLPDISGLSVPRRDIYSPNKTSQWDGTVGYGSTGGRTNYESALYSNSGSRTGSPLAFDELSPSKSYRDPFTLPLSSSSDTGSLWSRQPFEQFGLADKRRTVGGDGLGNRTNSLSQDFASVVDPEAKLLQAFRYCILKLLKLEGSDWLFKQNDGADEDLIDQVAAREKFIYDAETREMSQVGHMGEPLVSSVPHCGDGCVWKTDLIVSFGVWCIHRILDLSLMESRPELWGKYTYVLNRLQGIIDLAFSKPRTPMTACFCLQIPLSYQQKSSPSPSPPVSNGMLPPAVKPIKGRCTTAPVLLDTIKDVEIAISCRKGRTGTAAGDVAFPKGKENLASVLKRYKRRLANKPVATTTIEGGGGRKVGPYGGGI